MSGISGVLYEFYGDGVPIYVDVVEQGFKEPCFFVELISSVESHVHSRRYYRSNKFKVTYYPKVARDYGELEGVSERLLELLENLETVSGKYGSQDMSSKIEDGKLEFWVVYDFYVIKGAPICEMMGGYTLEVEL